MCHPPLGGIKFITFLLLNRSQEEHSQSQFMPNPDSSFLSRRQWLGMTPTLAAASVGSSLLATRALADDQMPAASSGADALLGAKVYNIRDFGAKGDGKTSDTAALQAAIDACNHDQGGTVLVPAGVFVIGTTELKSNVTLHIAAQGTLLGSLDKNQYHAADKIPLEGDATLEDGNVGLLFAKQPRGGGADAAAGTGHDYDLAHASSVIWKILNARAEN